MSGDVSPILAGGWAIYVQPNGPNTVPEYLACHDGDDPEQDVGDMSLILNPDPDQPNRWRIIGSYQTEPSPASFGLTALVQRTKDIMDGVVDGQCPVPLYLAEYCGKRNIFDNWDSQIIPFYPSIVTSKGMQNVGKRSQSDQSESMKNYSIAAETWYPLYKPIVGAQSTTEAGNLYGISICNVPRCISVCGPAKAKAEDLIAVSAAESGSPSDTASVIITSDKGLTWTAAVAAPFGAGEDIADSLCFALDDNTTRYLVARGTTDAGNPMEVAYSDDGGATWTTVNVGSTNGQYSPGRGQVFYYFDNNNIWLCTSGGYVYKTTDQGVTWTAQHSASQTSNDLHAIHGSDRHNIVAVGATDTILKSKDGGLTWQTTTATGGGVTLNTVAVLDKNRFWVGDAAGGLYYTLDGGSTWTQRTSFKGTGTGSINSIAFANDLVGYMAHDDATPRGYIHLTVNGGFSWTRLPDQPVNTGINDVAVGGPDLAYAVGDVLSSGVAYIARIASV